MKKSLQGKKRQEEFLGTSDRRELPRVAKYRQPFFYPQHTVIILPPFDQCCENVVIEHRLVCEEILKQK